MAETSPTVTSTRLRRLTASAPAPRVPASSRPAQILSYMHRPPRIMPNYGKKPRSCLPKSNVSRVLLYDNVTQQQMLHVKMTHLRAEQRKTGRLMDMHRRSFIVRRLQKEQQMAETALHVDHEQLERGLVNGNKATDVDKTRGDSHRHFNPYLDSEEDGSEKANTHTVDHHDATQLTNAIMADDATTQHGELGDKAETPLPFLSVDRRRAITSGWPAVSPSPVHKAGSQRAVYTAMEPRELGGQNGLPHLHPANGKVILHMDNHQHSGLTRILHTFPSHDSWEEGSHGKKGRGGRTRGGGGGRTTEDERYRKLEKMLVRIEPPNEGYLELSPSFHSPRQAVTFSRPSSFYCPLYRRRSSSSSSSLTRGSFSIQVQDL